MTSARFCPRCGSLLPSGTSFCSRHDVKVEQNNRRADASPSTALPIKARTKSSLAVLLLCLFLGVFGVHRFYVGKTGTGLLMLLTAGGAGIWLIVDLISILCNDFEDKNGNIIQVTENLSALKKIALVIVGILLATLVYHWKIGISGISPTTAAALTELFMDTAEDHVNGNYDWKFEWKDGNWNYKRSTSPTSNPISQLTFRS